VTWQRYSAYDASPSSTSGLEASQRLLEEGGAEARKKISAAPGSANEMSQLAALHTCAGQHISATMAALASTMPLPIQRGGSASLHATSRAASIPSRKSPSLQAGFRYSHRCAERGSVQGSCA